jgi:hypothetical protein
MDNSGAEITLTVPTNASVAFATGTQILVVRGGTGEAGVTGDTGVTVESAGNEKRLSNQYSGATLLKNGSDSWWLFGDLKV